MIFRSLLIGIFVIMIGLLTVSMNHSDSNDSDYKKAISIGEMQFSNFKINRNDYKLIEIKNDVLKNHGGNWRLTYLSKDCISKEGLRNCLGGEVFITVNVRTGETGVHWGE